MAYVWSVRTWKFPTSKVKTRPGPDVLSVKATWEDWSEVVGQRQPVKQCDRAEIRPKRRAGDSGNQCRQQPGSACTQAKDMKPVIGGMESRSSAQHRRAQRPRKRRQRTAGVFWRGSAKSTKGNDNDQMPMSNESGANLFHWSLGLVMVIPADPAQVGRSAKDYVTYWQ